MKKILSLFLAGIMIFSCVACGNSNEKQEKNGEDGQVIKLWVAPNGNDKAAGTESKPLASTDEALSRIREEEYAEAYIYYKGGKYYLEETIQLSGEDHNIHFCAAEGENPQILGAIPVDGWKEETVNGIHMWVTEIEEEKRGFESLFSEEKSLSQSRWPKEGYFTVESASATEGYGTTDPNLKMQYAMNINGNEVLQDVKLEDITNLNDITLKIIHWWKDETVKIQSFDSASGRVEFSRPATMTIKSGDRFYLENVFESMSEPGEWYMNDQTGKLYYIPYEGEKIKTTQIYAGRLERFVESAGADNISFEGLNFAMGDWSIPEGTYFECGADHHQAAYDVTPAFHFTDTKNVAIVNCSFKNINSTCLKFGYDVQGMTVTNNVFQDIGANAVFIVGQNLEKGNTRITKDFLISNNLIERYGQTFFNATAIGILHGAEGEISNNDIHDGYSTAITIGWVWGYGYSVTKNVLVKQNLIYNVGQNLLSDMGAIYTLGVKEGIVITENVIHDVQANMQYGYGGWGIYMDEGSSNVMVNKNLVYDCSSTSFYQHYGQDNIIMNNIFAFSDQGQVSLAKAQEHIGFHLIRNIIISNGSPFITGMKGKDLFTDSSNFYWDYSNGDQGIDTERYNEEYGLYRMATFIDPRFTDAEERNFVLRDFSPAIESGFVKWDIKQAGLK